MSDNIFGFFDERGFPCMKFDLQAENSPIPKRTLTGIIDTGSTGFLQIPQDIAVQLSFAEPEPRSAVDVGFGDGRSRLCPMVRGYATLGSETKTGSVIVAPGGRILIGMSFLRAFRKALFVSTSSGVKLIPDELP